MIELKQNVRNGLYGHTHPSKISTQAKAQRLDVHNVALLLVLKLISRLMEFFT